MNGTQQKPVNGQAQLQLEPLQLATMLVLDALAKAMETGMNQLGGFLGLKREADIIANALSHLQRDKQRLIEEWQKRIVIAPAAALSVIESKKA